MLYQIIDGTISLEGQTVLSHIDFEIKEKEKIAIVGRNGSGKTTLLRLIAGELELDRDDKRKDNKILTSRKVSIGMLRQNQSLEENRTIEEILLESCVHSDKYSKERYLYEMEYDRIFTGFGFKKEDKKRKLSSFSGGEQTKIALIQLLLLKPDILLLDEPTNHLDIQTVEWLEQYMTSYEKAVVFVSHDRFFLDQVVEAVYEIQDGRTKRYAGNYTQYRTQKRKDIALQMKAYERQQAELERLNDLVEKFKHKPKKAAFARSRKTMMQRMDRIEKPKSDDAHIFTGAIEPQILGGKWVYEAEHLKIGYDKPLLEISLRVKRGQKIGIIGDNGVGKSTFLKTIAGLLPEVDGKGNIGQNILIGYFDQQAAAIESDKKVIKHFHDLFPGMTEKEVRQVLGAYLFSGKDAAKRVSDLSGGEKARLVLAEILTSKPNFLILDEPTNHMDVWAKETLESAFGAYTGTIVFVSHDRYFIQQVAESILLFENQTAYYYPFGYEHYLKKSRSNDGTDITALMQAEEQAMIADFHAVPRKETGRFRTIGTEEAYLDWKLRLAAEPMEKTKTKTENLWLKWQELEKQMELLTWKAAMKKWNMQFECKEEGEESKEEIELKLQELLQRRNDLESLLTESWNEWTMQCKAWYSILEPEDDEM